MKGRSVPSPPEATGKSVPPPRRRRTAEEARAEILDAAERRLAELGPDGVRLQQIAADVGVSHPAILHHFESRERLLSEVVRRAIQRLEADIVQAIASKNEADEPPALETIEAAHRVLVAKGHARVLAWLMLAGQTQEGGTGVRTVAEVAHERRVRIEPNATFEDTLFRVLLAGLAMIGEAVAGPTLRAAARRPGEPEDAQMPERFRAWLAKLLTTSLESG
ncbi:MAG TPA: TetR/AcrR family transcriptional regulator [Polyangiaceae bacterium]|nr:TetR/AcrR family transcriptional regulator [Polyangiaceae bacterium]